ERPGIAVDLSVCHKGTPQTVYGVCRVLLPRGNIAQRPHLAVGSCRALGFTATDDVPVGKPLALFGACGLVCRRQRGRLRVDLDVPLADHDVELLLIRARLRSDDGWDGEEAGDQQNSDVRLHESGD